MVGFSTSGSHQVTKGTVVSTKDPTGKLPQLQIPQACKYSNLDEMDQLIKRNFYPEIYKTNSK